MIFRQKKHWLMPVSFLFFYFYFINFFFLNVQIKNLADEFSYTYLDLFNTICDENQRTKDEYTIDGLHLSAKGYEAWTSLVKPYLV